MRIVLVILWSSALLFGTVGRGPHVACSGWRNQVPRVRVSAVQRRVRRRRGGDRFSSPDIAVLFRLTDRRTSLPPVSSCPSLDPFPHPSSLSPISVPQSHRVSHAVGTRMGNKRKLCVCVRKCRRDPRLGRRRHWKHSRKSRRRTTGRLLLCRRCCRREWRRSGICSI